MLTPYCMTMCPPGASIGTRADVRGSLFLSWSSLVFSIKEASSRILFAIFINHTHTHFQNFKSLAYKYNGKKKSLNQCPKREPPHLKVKMLIISMHQTIKPRRYNKWYIRHLST